VFLSTNDGASWLAVNGGLPNLAGPRVTVAAAALRLGAFRDNL
jgi:hypothetical protein